MRAHVQINIVITKMYTSAALEITQDILENIQIVMKLWNQDRDNTATVTSNNNDICSNKFDSSNRPY